MTPQKSSFSLFLIVDVALKDELVIIFAYSSVYKCLIMDLFMFVSLNLQSDSCI